MATTVTESFDTDVGFLYNAKEIQFGSGFETTTTLTLNSGEDDPCGIALDEDNDLAFIICRTSPGILVKCDISGTGAPTRVSAFTLPENNPQAIAFDPVGGYVYVACDTSPVTVVKVDPATMTQAGSTLTLNAGEVFGGIESGIALFGSLGVAIVGCYDAGTNLRFVKIALGSGAASPTRLDRLEIARASISAPSAITRDGATDENGMAWFGTNDSGATPGVLVKLNPQGSGATAPTLVGSVPASSNGSLNQIVVDDRSGYVYARTADSGLRVEKFTRGAAAAVPTSLGSYTVGAAASAFSRGLVFNPPGAYLFAGYGSDLQFLAGYTDNTLPTLIATGTAGGVTTDNEMVRGACSASSGRSFFVSRKTPGRLHKFRISFAGPVQLRTGETGGTLQVRNRDDRSGWGVLWKVVPSIVEALQHSFRWLLSFDERISYRYWLAGEWIAADLADIATYGNTTQDLALVRTFLDTDDLAPAVRFIRAGSTYGSLSSIAYTHGEEDSEPSAETVAGPYDSLAIVPDYPLAMEIRLDSEGAVFDSGHVQRYQTCTEQRYVGTWSWGALSATNRNTLVTFLRAHTDDAFEFTLPGEVSPRLWRATNDPEAIAVGLGVYAVACEIEEVLA